MNSLGASRSWFWIMNILIIAMVFSPWCIQVVTLSPIPSEGMFPDFMMNAQLANSVPRMGRRSLSPFMRAATNVNGGSTTSEGGFRVLNGRPRRRIGPYNPFGGGLSGFRFAAGPGLYQGALRNKRMPEIVSTGASSLDTSSSGSTNGNLDNLMRQSKRVLPPVHVGASMFPTVRHQQNMYWENLLSEAARESLLQRLAGAKDAELEKISSQENGDGSADSIPQYSSSPLARFLSRYQGNSRRSKT